MQDLKNKKILITGGGGNGLASGICKALDQNGAKLIINEVTENNFSNLRDTYPHAIFIQADISREEEVENMFVEIEEKVGILDGLVNNAGIGMVEYAHQVDTIGFDELYNVDVKGLWQVSKSFVNHLLKHNHSGNIVNITSIHVLKTVGRYALYSSAKSAVEGLTRGMAIELGKYNIRVNSVGPGFVHSDQNQNLLQSLTDDPEKWVDDHIHHYQVVNKVMEPVNCGNVIAFLLSQLSDGVTGQAVYVDHGTSLLLYANDFIKK